MPLKWEPTITLGNVVELTVFLSVVLKSYGNWRILNYRIGIMWADYCRRQKMHPEQDSNHF